MQPQSTRPLTLSLRLQGKLGWIITAIICVIPVIAWFMLNPPAEAMNNPYRILGSIGKITGLVGLVLYSLNLVYATRLRFLEKWFGGLNRVYIAHHLVGGLALIALAQHPVLLALEKTRSSMRSAALLLLPDGLGPVSALFDSSSPLHTSVLYEWAILFGSIAFFGMVVLLIITFFAKIPYKLWLLTHKFLGLFFFIGGLHVFFIESDTSEGFLRLYVLTIVLIGLLAFTYKTLLGSILIRKYQYKVDSVSLEGDVISLEMSPIQAPMSYKPGQFIFIQLPGALAQGINNEWHPFSIASAPTGGTIGIKVKALGDYSKSLLNALPGMTVTVEGAYGRFTYTNFKNTDQIWIAGGIGITPFLSMAQSLHLAQNYKVDLYYSVKSESELIGIQKLTELVNMPNATLRVIPYDTSKYGFLTPEAITRISGNLVAKEFFICGPPAMMKSMRKQLVALKVPNSSIHSEEFSMS
jgi:predicted ferric reductase